MLEESNGSARQEHVKAIGRAKLLSNQKSQYGLTDEAAFWDATAAFLMVWFAEAHGGQ
jgi:hypothetical protein